MPEAVRSLRRAAAARPAREPADAVPDWIAELPRLEKLDLRWNEVYDPPAALLARGCVVLTE